MKSAITHLWSSLRDLATQSPILLALIAVFSCTPFYLEQDWFADIDLWFYGLYFFIVILQSYITRDRKYSIVYTLLSIGISVGLYTIHETYHHIRGIELATENISYLWLYSMIALYFTSHGEYYIGEIINRLKRIGITIVTSTLYNVVIIMTLWFFFIILNKPFTFDDLIFKVLAAINIFICMSMLCTYKEEPDGPPEPNTFYNVVFGIILPKASIITGILANIYLVLILLGLREDARFLYTYYPYVAIFYLFYLASFRSSESSKTQRILCFLFITITILCLILIGKRVINEPVLWLNTIYVAAFNLIFLAHNVYSFVKRLTPSIHTTIMALALGAVLLMPFIGYTSHREFTNYTKIDGQWHVYLPITETFNPDFTDYGRTIIQGDSPKLGATEIYKERNIQFISFTAVEEPHVISLVGYNKFISNIELEVREPADSTADIPTASYESINFRFINEGLDLEVSLPNGVTEVHHIYEKFLTVPKTASDSVIIEGTRYKLLIHSYYAYQDSARRIIFSVLYN